MTATLEARPGTSRRPSRRCWTSWRPDACARPSRTRRRPMAGGSGPRSRRPSWPASATGRWRPGRPDRSRSATGRRSPPRDLADGPWRIVPGGTAVRRGAHLADGVVVMPPSYVNIGAWIGEGTMVDSHVLVGSCAQVGRTGPPVARASRSAGCWSRPAPARSSSRTRRSSEPAARCSTACSCGPGRSSRPGVTLTGTSRIYDLVRERVIEGSPDRPLVVPAGAVVVPGARSVPGSFAAANGLSISVALLVKDRDARTSARVALEDALR